MKGDKRAVDIVDRVQDKGIDKLVYELYRLSEDDVNVLEGE